MTIKSETYFTVSCDECDTMHDTEGEGIFRVYDTATDAEEDVTSEYDWLRVAGRLLCPGCVEELPTVTADKDEETRA